MSRIAALLGGMTLNEKLGQLTMTTAGLAVTGARHGGDLAAGVRSGMVGNVLNLYGAGPVHAMQRIAMEESRLRIPLLFGLDILHGHRTLFPVPLAEAAALDPAAWEHSAREAAAEGGADGIAMSFAPMLDVSRDPRWGRTVEGPGEDPWLASVFARAKVRGFQGANLGAPDAMAAVAKHFCAYGAPTAGRDYAPVDISERTLHEVHLPAFGAAVEAGVAAIMPAFTDLAGVPLTAHAGLLRGYLRERLGFDGVIVSDYTAIAELIRHGIAADLAHAAALALAAGVDIDMMAEAYGLGLPPALERGIVTMDQIDAAVLRVLSLKERLGLFDDPFARGARREAPAAIAQRRQFARRLGSQSIVLLKNAGNVLPLAPTIRTLALIGPLADAADQMGGPWWAAGGDAPHVSVLAGLRTSLPDVAIRHAAGGGIDDADPAAISAAIEACRGAQAIVLCLGESVHMSGEAACRADPGLPGQQAALADAVARQARALGVPLVALLFCGRPLVVPQLDGQVDALLWAGFLGTEAGHAVADVLSGRVSPGGRTPITWPRAVGQIPIFHAQRSGGRPENPADRFTSKYLDLPNAPLYPFGHGLTYGHFTLSQLQVAPATVREADTIDISVEVRNDGPHAAEETVFLFTRDPVACVARPLLELRGFGKIALAPGQAGTLRLRLAARVLRFLGLAMTPVFEPGEVQILVGPCADRAQLLAASVLLAQ